ncbi:uncharacterized protein I206_103964 [Kwoniella pini CBS 10737]|uniref:Palmitoyltransferase n=1 Tax=Kwoniella pini CBS 10737 TaxID=1296096 RepID=A0A1B9I310_9TREE|nr:uncharacterized protein I206_04463 [Kwoniella pini CBS 10737]OCF49932.1 hypothetical protein I206_04463 [Kwoniella pini CBS 10737]
MVEEQRENNEAHELGHTPSTSAFGVSLPHRSASITLHNHNAAGAGDFIGNSHNGGLVRRDSLEDTKSFYGVNRPTSPPSSSQRSNSALPKAGQRIRSIRSTTSSFTSPSRVSAPLPTPKGFLSPKKPNLAIRLERKKERNLSLSSDHSNGTGTQNSKPTLSNEGNDNKPIRGDTSDIELISSRSISPLQEEEPEVQSFGGTALALSEDNRQQSFSEQPSNPSLDISSRLHNQGWDKSIGRSITEMSTPPRTAASELSSDELVNRDNAKNKDLEKGHAQNASDTSRSQNQRKVSKSSHAPAGVHNKTNRKYQHFENPLTTFWWNGKLVTGGDNWWSFILIVVVLLGLSGVWIGTTGAWLWIHGTEYGLLQGAGVAITIIYVYLFALTASSLLASAFRDPGIIPRKLDPDPPMYETEEYWEAWPRELDVNGGKVTVKYCETCQSYRPPRSSHCRLCGNCVDGIDHHCSYLHSCVGKRNYFSFLVTLLSATAGDIYVVIFSAIHFSLLCHHDNISFGTALSESPGAAVSFLLGVILIFPILFLLWYHLRLLLYNLTTVEQIRANTSTSLFVTSTRPDNPFSSNTLFDNIILASIGRPQFPSWIDANGLEIVDRREINPALKDLRWVRDREGL